MSNPKNGFIVNFQELDDGNFGVFLHVKLKAITIKKAAQRSIPYLISNVERKITNIIYLFRPEFMVFQRCWK